MADPQLDYIVTAECLGSNYYLSCPTKGEAIERAQVLNGAAYERRRIYPAQAGPVFEYEGGIEAPEVFKIPTRKWSWWLRFLSNFSKGGKL